MDVEIYTGFVLLIIWGIVGFIVVLYQFVDANNTIDEKLSKIFIWPV